MSEIFISYRRDGGSDLASFLEAKLQNQGFESTIDVGNRYTGDFVTYIKNEISDCLLFIILISEGSIKRMMDPEDNSLMEIEHATKIGKPILPIILDKVDMFKDIKDYGSSLPESVKRLTKINCRFYKHEMREDTLSYIVDLAKELRLQRFLESKSTATIPEESLVMIPELDGYMKTVNDFPITAPDGGNYFYTGKILFKDIITGRGKLVSRNGTVVYNMDWSISERFSGTGTIHKDGSLLYEGSVSGLLYHGNGTLHTNQYKHTGSFETGIPKGLGTRVFADGTVMEGVWLKDTLVKEPFIKFKNGDMYVGKYSNGSPEGYGTLIRGDIRISGYFRNFTQFLNVIVERDEETYLGDLDSDLNYTGKGILLDSNKEPVYKGRFEKGSPTGQGELFYKTDHLSKLLNDMAFSLLVSVIDDFNHSTIIVEGLFEGGSLLTDKTYKLLDNERKVILVASEVDYKKQRLIEVYEPSGSLVYKVRV